MQTCIIGLSTRRNADKERVEKMTREYAYQIMEENFIRWYDIGGAEYMNKKLAEVAAMIDE